MQRCMQRRPPRLPRPFQANDRPAAFGGARVNRGNRRRTCLHICAAQTLYEVLGVQQTATSREIKAAYRKLALKLHPDVNKAPDAKDRFIEAKRAFETLADDKARADYDRQLRMGSMGGWGSSGFGGGYSSSGGSSYRRPNTPAEDNYSFDDLLRDLEKELSNWSQSRASGQPTSIWDEIESLGGELLDFVEDSLGIKEGEEAKAKGSTGGSSSGTSSTSSGSSTSGTGSSRSSNAAGAEARSKSSAERFDDFVRTYDTPSGSSGSSTGSSSRPGSGSTAGSKASAGAPGAGKKPDSSDDIDDMLLALKKKLNKL